MPVPFQSAADQIATTTAPLIVKGGASSSDQLNNFTSHVISDLSNLYNRTSINQNSQNDTRSLFVSQNQAMAAQISQLRALVESALPTAGVAKATVGFYVPDYVLPPEDPSLAAVQVDTTYGQVTLPILRKYEKMSAIDVTGNRFVPVEARISYFVQPPGGPFSIPTTESSFIDDEYFTAALDGRLETAWTREDIAGSIVFVRLRIPDSLNGHNLTNSIVINPAPTLTNTLLGVWTRGPEGAWIDTAPLSYQLGYNSSLYNTLIGSNGVVSSFGPVRVIIEPVSVTEVLIALIVQSPSITGTWGFSELGVQYLEFGPVGTLRVSYAQFLNISSSIFNSITIRGRNTALLAYLTPLTSQTPEVTIKLTQSIQGSSPVITRVDAYYTP